MVSLTNFRSVSELTSAGQDGRLANGMLHSDNNGQLRKYHFNQPATIENKPRATTLEVKNPPASDHFEIRWNNLTYQVEPKWYQRKLGALSSSSYSSSNQNQPASRSQSRKTNILNSLHGSVKSGQVTAILGPSGAGKTSLLGCLTGKNKSGVSGSVQIISNRQEPMAICQIPQKGE